MSNDAPSAEQRWLLLIHQLPSKPAYFRVKVWRRLPDWEDSAPPTPPGSLPVSAAEARPGDLVWWPGHVGIYTGNGNNIAARQPGTPLTEGPIYHSSPTFIRVS